jgi:methyl-CpG-binding domain protein 4
VDPSELRRSGRVAGAAAEHDGAALDAASSDEEDDGDGRAPKRRRTGAERDAEARALLAHSRQWLADSRAALARFGAAGGEAPAGAAAWRAEAVRRWGDAVVASLPPSAAKGDDVGWKGFVTSRLTTPPPPSSMELLQEFYAHDAWQLLACCALMSRVSSAAVKSRVLAAFFERCPTPSLFLDTPAEALQAIMHPLGLFPNRLQSLTAMSVQFLPSGDHGLMAAPVFEVGLTPETKIYGFGDFGVASFQIFCRGNLSAAPEDATLRAFLAWQKRRAAKAAKAKGDAPGDDDDGDESD